MKADLHIIVGSGPAGVSAAVALLARGCKVLMLDGGGELERSAVARRAKLAARLHADWTIQARQAYQQPQYETPAGQVRRFGSDFAQVAARETFAPGNEWFDLRASRAVGGLSNLWGGAVLANRAEDIRDWPISVADLAPHYAAVSNFIPVAATTDRIDKHFPGLSLRTHAPVQASSQASEILRRLENSKSSSVSVGRAKTAVQTGCQQCGLCLHGCPWQYIYSSAQTLSDLRSNPNFEHRPGQIVIDFSETAKGVALRLVGGQKLVGQRIYLATGVLETAAILLRSSPALETLTLKDSQHAFVPMLHRWRNSKRPDDPPYTTLPQLFAEIDDAEISPFLVHAQMYTWNEYFERDLIKNYGRKLPGSKPLWRALARQLVVAQIFLHSDHSAQVALRLAQDGRLDAILMANPETPDVLRSARLKLAAEMSKAGLTTLGFAARPGAPGSSFHAGGTVAMSQAPASGQSDILGRPSGLQRVHIVDASVLTSIPATTITFSVMANAHRIASLTP